MRSINELSLTNELSSLEPKIERYSKRFNFWRKTVFWMPITLTLIQLIALNQKISFDLSLYHNWKSVPEVFVVPMTAFSFCIAITGLYGLYLRSLQTESQLIKAHQQVSISEKQFALAQAQFRDISERNNFSNYIEHYNHFKNTIQTISEEVLAKHGNASLFNSVNIETVRLYKKVFPENMPDHGVKYYYRQLPESTFDCSKFNKHIKESSVQLKKFYSNENGCEYALFAYSKAFKEAYNMLSILGFDRSFAPDYELSFEESRTDYIPKARMALVILIESWCMDDKGGYQCLSSLNLLLDELKHFQNLCEQE